MTKQMTTIYCPRCGTPNPEGVNFCRSCGIELEAVALMLRAASPPPTEVSGNKSEPKTDQDWVAKHTEGVRGISTGVTLMLVSVLIGVAMAFFVPGHIPWILAWAVLVSWMAVWGGIELGNGIAGVFAARSRLRLMRRTDGKSAIASRPLPMSVTEATTRQLDD